MEIVYNALNIANIVIFRNKRWKTECFFVTLAHKTVKIMNNKATFIERVTQIAKGAIFPIGAIALFLGVSMLYFLPQYQDKALVQHDVVQYQGMCHDIMENREATGEDAQWTGNMFGGITSQSF